MSEKIIPIDKYSSPIKAKWQYWYNQYKTKFYKQTVKFANFIQDKFSNCREFRIFHELIGSTPRPGSEVVEGDFPGEYSIENFLDISQEERESLLLSLSQDGGVEQKAVNQ